MKDNNEKNNDKIEQPGSQNKLDNDNYIDMNNGIKGYLKQWIDIIYWFRNGTERFRDNLYENNKPLYPFRPSDVLGKLKNGKYFYYKDCFPNQYPGKIHWTHTKWMYLIADDMESLFRQMDKRDIKLFINFDKEYDEQTYETL
eukprot:129081_1